MKHEHKAALLSALVVPGAGQIFLKRYARGALFILPFLAGCFTFGWVIVSTSLSIIRAAPFQKGTVDAAAVLQVTRRSVEAVDFPFLTLLFILLVLLWALSVFDAYRLGKTPEAPITTSGGQ